MKRVKTAKFDVVIIGAGATGSTAALELCTKGYKVALVDAGPGDGTRKISHVTEVLGMEGDVITTQDIFVFQQSNMSLPGKTVGKFIPTGFIPRFVEQLTKRGIVIPRTLFKAA